MFFEIGTSINPTWRSHFVLLADDGIEIDAQANSDGNIHSNNDLKFNKGNPSTHTGNLTAVDDIEIDKDNTIIGDVTAGGNLDIHNNATVTGNASGNTPVATELLPTLSFTAGGNDVTVNKNQSLSLALGSYGDVKVKANGVLFLNNDGSSGDYFFEKLELNQEAKLSLDVTNGAVTINVVEKIDFDKDTEVEIIPLGENGTRLVTFNSISKVTIDQEAKILGTIIAPEDTVKFSKNVSLKGAVCAMEIEVDQDGTFLHHSSTISLSRASFDEILN